MLKEQFDSVFSSPNNANEEPSPSPQIPLATLSDIEITEENIAAQIKELRSKAAAGPDDIPAVLLKNCVNSVKGPLCKFWKPSFQGASFREFLKLL